MFRDGGHILSYLRPDEVTPENREHDMDWASEGLHEAALQGDFFELKRLLACGADKDARGRYGETPLHWAALRGRVDCLKELLASGSDKEAKDRSGRTPLHVAARHDHLDCLDELLASGSDKDARDNYGRTSLYFARTQPCKALLMMQEVPEEALEDALQWFVETSEGVLQAAKSGYLDKLRKLLADGADKEARDVNRSTPLHLAARNGRIECLRELLAAGCIKEARDDSGSTPLHLAAFKGHVQCVCQLLAAGCDKEARDDRGPGLGQQLQLQLLLL
eukprot:s9437_g1.t1